MMIDKQCGVEVAHYQPDAGPDQARYGMYAVPPLTWGSLLYISHQCHLYT